MDSAEDPNKQPDEGASLDDGADALEKPEPINADTKATQDNLDKSIKKPNLKQRLSKFNVYLVMFVFVLVVAGVIIGIAYFQSKKASTTTVKSQSLSSSTLQQLANSDATVGGPQQVLNVEANAVFAGKVLVREALEVASGIQVSGGIGVDNLTVSGTSNLQDTTVAKDLTVAGNLSVQGSGTFSGGIQVNGSGTFSGDITTPELTTPSFQLNGDLTLTHHFIAGGVTPSSTSGGGLGGGGTSTVNGSDTAGTINVNVGGSPGAGCFITVTFAKPYAQTPYVLLTPVGKSSGGVAYYVTATPSTFSVCTSVAATANTQFGFNYFVVD